MYSMPVIVAPAAAVATGSCQTSVRLREVSGLALGEGLGDLGRACASGARTTPSPLIGRLRRRRGGRAAGPAGAGRRVVQVGGDLRLADRDPRQSAVAAARAYVLVISLISVASNRAVGAWFLQATDCEAPA